MHQRLLALFAFCGLALVFLAPAPAGVGDDPAADEELLEDLGFAIDGPALRTFFRNRTLPDAERDALLEKLIKQLGDGRSKVRQQAAAELLGHGIAAVEALKVAVEGSNRAISERAKSSLKRIEKGIGQSVAVAAARLLARRHPDGAAAVLFAYLTRNNEEWVREEILRSLAAVAVHQGKPDPVLSAGLDDPLPGQRAAAVYLLAQVGGPGQRATVRRLLTDQDELVRRRAAQGLVGAENLQDEATEADEALLKAQGVGIDAEAIMAYLRKRSLTPKDRQHLQELVQDLGASQFRKRKKAMEELTRVGTPALRYLHPALQDSNVEVSKRAAICVTQIERGPGTTVPAAAVRLLIRLAPAEAIRVLLGFIPSADDIHVDRAIRVGLANLAVRDVKLDPAFTAVLSDSEPARRAAAAYVLGRAGLASDCRAVRGMLRDPEPLVRLRAAQGLVHAQDPAALPVLVKLLDPKGDWEARGQAEEVLRQLARDQAPADSVVAKSPAEREKAFKAWNAWWQAHARDIDLAQPSWNAGQRGLTVVCELDGSPDGGGQVWEFSRDLRPRWSLDPLQGPMDAHVLGGGKVLVVEAAARRISERDLKGKILWQVETTGLPVACQPLPDGHTLIATQTGLIEINAEHEEVYNHNRQVDGRITSAHKAPNGHIVYITDQGFVVEFDPREEGTVVYRFRVGEPAGPCSVEWLPNGRYLVALSGPGKVMEVGKSGKPIWQIKIADASQALRLANGHLLVACQNRKLLTEVTPAGKVIWETRTRGRPTRVHRR
jgi:HEAT repeat protein